MLAEMGDRRFCLGNLLTHSYEDMMLSKVLLDSLIGFQPIVVQIRFDTIACKATPSGRSPRVSFVSVAWGSSGTCNQPDLQALLSVTVSLYGNCMARLISTTIRLDQEDVRALKRARAAGYSASELIRKGLRVVASRYYSRRRPPSTRLFESTDQKLGDESELFRNLER